MGVPPRFADAVVRTARWSAWDHSGLEAARISIGREGIQVTGEIAAEPGERPWAQYAIACDAAWRTLDVRVGIDQAWNHGCVADIELAGGRITLA